MIPLQIFEKHPTADAYRVGGFYSPYALVSTDKRFTDSELAAEYWRANWHKGKRVDPKTYAWEWEHAIMHRLLASPHASDSDYQ